MVVDEVRGAPRADMRAGDVIVAVTAQGRRRPRSRPRSSSTSSLGEIDKATTLTLHVRRGEANVFVTIRGETAGG